MTISTTLRKAGPFVGNGVTTAFPFAFKVFADSDVVVTTVITATGVESEKVLTTDYTVALNADQNANPGGVVNMLVAPPATQKLVITSDVPMTQGVLVTNLGGFYPDVFNNALDRLTIFAQQLYEITTRALTVAVTSNVNGTIPVLAGGLIRFNAGGTGFEALSISELAGITANNTLIDDDVIANSAVRASSKNAVRGYVDAQIATRQPLDADLTAIAALATTAFGRGFLALADAAAGRALIDAASNTGTTTNNDAAAGKVGEVIEGTRAEGSALALTTSVAVNLASISLTAGDWEVEGSIGFIGGAGTIQSGWVHNASATPPPRGKGMFYSNRAFGGGEYYVYPTGRRRFSLSATTTIYLGAVAAHSGTVTAYGDIYARRIR